MKHLFAKEQNIMKLQQILSLIFALSFICLSRYKIDKTYNYLGDKICIKICQNEYNL